MGEILFKKNPIYLSFCTLLTSDVILFFSCMYIIAFVRFLPVLLSCITTKLKSVHSALRKASLLIIMENDASGLSCRMGLLMYLNTTLQGRSLDVRKEKRGEKVVQTLACLLHLPRNQDLLLTLLTGTNQWSC